jgi:hypothetical protein
MRYLPPSKRLTSLDVSLSMSLSRCLSLDVSLSICLFRFVSFPLSLSLSLFYSSLFFSSLSFPLPRCRHHVHGCSWKGVAATAEQHAVRCTFQSWVSTCTHCKQPVVASDMDNHLRNQCTYYRCVKCAVKDQTAANHSEMHLKSTVVRLVLGSGYRFGPTTPMDMTKMFVFHGDKKKPTNVSRDAVFNLLKTCYLRWKNKEVSAWEVRMVFGAVSTLRLTYMYTRYMYTRYFTT